MSGRVTRILWPIFWTVLVLAAGGALLALNETAREVALETAKTLFGIFSTPFILETTVALFALFIVMAINRWRLEKEGDGWVYMVCQEPEPGAAKLPASITQRLQGVVMQEKPETMDEDGTTRARIEGFLELGMAAQAAESLAECTTLPDDEVTNALRVRVLAANLETAAAQQLLHTATERFAGHHTLFAQTALDCSLWLEAHAPQQREAMLLWQAEVSGIKS